MAGSDDVVAPRWHTREDSGLTIDREGRWFHDGVRIEHPNIIEAFNRGLRVQPDGRVQLHFGNDWCFVVVERCAFGVVAIDEGDGGRLSVRLTDRTAEWLDPATLALDADGVLEIAVKSGLARARFSRDAQFQLMSRLEPRGDALVLKVGEREWPTPLRSQE